MKWWKCFGELYPRQEVVYCLQMFIIYVVIFAAIGNLTCGTDQANLWIALLSSSLGYILPNPTVVSGSGAVKLGSTDCIDGRPLLRNPTVQ